VKFAFFNKNKMKTIYIARHAKSSWDEPGLSDHDRPLIAAGIKKTNLVIDYLKAKKVMPGLIITSTARRAKDTALLVADGLGYPQSKVIFEEKMYHASPNSIMDELYTLEDGINSVMIFGHNPTLTYFVNQFLDPPIVNLPTSGLVAIEFDTGKWVDISAAKYRNRFTVFPKMLR
jgi:phosphohistidine phosphatase